MTLEVPSLSLKRTLESATQTYSRALHESPMALEYLTNRGLTLQAMDYFRLGFVPDDCPAEHRIYAGRIAIPYITPSGVVDIRFKALPDENGLVRGNKMLSLPGQKSKPYNVKAIHQDYDYMIVAEGEPDTWTGVICGLPTLGFPGATTFKPEFHPRLLRYRKIIVVAHNDDKGDGRKFAEAVTEHLADGNIVMCPEGHDLNSWYLHNGTDGRKAVRELVGIPDDKQD